MRTRTAEASHNMSACARASEQHGMGRMTNLNEEIRSISQVDVTDEGTGSPMEVPPHLFCIEVHVLFVRYLQRVPTTTNTNTRKILYPTRSDK